MQTQNGRASGVCEDLSLLADPNARRIHATARTRRRSNMTSPQNRPGSTPGACTPCVWTPEAQTFFSLGSGAEPSALTSAQDARAAATNGGAASVGTAAAAWTPGCMHAADIRRCVCPLPMAGVTDVRSRAPTTDARPTAEAITFFSLGTGREEVGKGGGASGVALNTEAAGAALAGRAPLGTRAADPKVWTPEVISFFTLGQAPKEEGTEGVSLDDGRWRRSPDPAAVCRFLWGGGGACIASGVV